MGGCKKHKFWLNHPDPDLFHRSQWDAPGKTSNWYVAYRVVLACLMAAGIAAHIASFTDVNWLIFMTDQGISLLTLHYLLYAGLVVARQFCGTDSSHGSLPWPYRLSWWLQTMTFSTALFISLVYWITLHPLVVKANMLRSTWQQFLNAFLHALNSVSCFIDMLVTARPVYLHHFYIPMMFGLFYTTFSLVFWAAGGTTHMAICHFNLNTSLLYSHQVLPLESLTPLNTTDCVVSVQDYIYPILDWSGHPGWAVMIVGLGCVAIPVIHVFWWMVYKARVAIAARIMGNN